MLHRFADPHRGNAGHDPDTLWKQLAALRRTGRELVTTQEIVRRAREHELRDTSPVAFTVDDGYADFATVAAPIFAEFDCPVTVFVVSGVLDGEGWYWWDRISAAFEQTTRREIVLSVGDRPLRLVWTSDGERQRAELALMEALKPVSDLERHQLLDSLPSTLDVVLPERPPEKYAPMTWEQVRRCATGGADFGAHTVTHPILSRVDANAAQREIAVSWRRLREETSATSDVFCYPNGGTSDFGAREIAILQEHGFGSAVTTVPGHVTSTQGAGTGREGAYRIPRFSYPEEPRDADQILRGVERFKLGARQLFQSVRRSQ